MWGFFFSSTAACVQTTFNMHEVWLLLLNKCLWIIYISQCKKLHFGIIIKTWKFICDWLFSNTGVLRQCSTLHTYNATHNWIAQHYPDIKRWLNISNSIGRLLFFVSFVVSRRRFFFTIVFAASWGLVFNTQADWQLSICRANAAKQTYEFQTARSHAPYFIEVEYLKRSIHSKPYKTCRCRALCPKNKIASAISHYRQPHQPPSLHHFPLCSLLSLTKPIW